MGCNQGGHPYGSLRPRLLPPPILLRLRPPRRGRLRALLPLPLATPSGTERAAPAPSYYHHRPPPPGTGCAAPAAARSSSSASPLQLNSFATSTGSPGLRLRPAGLLYAKQYPPAQHPAPVGGIGTLRGGNRGVGPSHVVGTGQGSSGCHPHIQNVGVTSPRGRARGRGRGHGSQGSGWQLLVAAPPRSSVAEALPGSGMASAPGQLQVTTANTARGPVLPAWCDICRVECNSEKILELHKNGKRHKRAFAENARYGSLARYGSCCTGRGHFIFSNW